MKTTRAWIRNCLLVGACLLIATRVALPYIVLHYATQQINKIPEYQVHIADLDIHLLQGRYTIKNLELRKMAANVPVPFFKSDVIDFSLQWRALLKGKFVGEIVVGSPTVNFVTGPDKTDEQLTINQQWVEIVRSLFPLNINQITVHHGTIFLKSFRGDPPFSIYLKDIEFQLRNMQNAQRLKSGLLSTMRLQAKAMDNANVKIEGKLDPFANKPTFYLTASIKSLPIPEINAFLKHYVDVKAKSGQFSLFLEAAAADAKITGYAKPFLTNFTVDVTEKGGPFHQLYTHTIDAAARVLENRQQKSIATQINFSGRVDDPNVSILSVIFYFLQHGFIQALLPQIDQKISMQDIQYPPGKSVSSPKFTNP